MISSLDLLQLILALCALVVTGVVVAVGIQLLRVLGDIDRISRNVEEITVLVERLSQVVFPGMERVAKGADRLQKQVVSFLEKKSK